MSHAISNPIITSNPNNNNALQQQHSLPDPNINTVQMTTQQNTNHHTNSNSFFYIAVNATIQSVTDGEQHNGKQQNGKQQNVDKLTAELDKLQIKQEQQTNQQQQLLQQHPQQQHTTITPTTTTTQQQEPTTELTETKYFIDINRTNIPFGKTTLFPGSIQQVDVVIQLKQQILQQNGNANPFMLRVIAKCNNPQFNDLDQYVFSVRSNQRFQYFEEVRFKIRKREKAQVKVAVKIPPVKQNCVIDGFLEVQLQGLQPICYPIVAKCQVPQITCIKDLYKPDEDTQVIKVPAKKNQIRMPPIPFKNLSNFNFTLEVQAISNESFANKPYDIITQNFVNCQANTQFFVNLQLKENMSYKGPLPAKETIRKILILKIKNSSVYFNYPLEVFVFESVHGGGMS